MLDTECWQSQIVWGELFENWHTVWLSVEGKLAVGVLLPPAPYLRQPHWVHGHAHTLAHDAAWTTKYKHHSNLSTRMLAA